MVVKHERVLVKVFMLIMGLIIELSPDWATFSTIISQGLIKYFVLFLFSSRLHPVNLSVDPEAVQPHAVVPCLTLIEGSVRRPAFCGQIISFLIKVSFYFHLLLYAFAPDLPSIR